MSKLTGIHLTEDNIKHAAEVSGMSIDTITKHMARVREFDEDPSARVYMLQEGGKNVILLERALRMFYRFPNGEVLNKFAEVEAL